MAIDFPTPTQVGELFTDSTTGVTYECEQLGPPVVWICYGGASPTPDEYVTLDTTQTISGVKTFSGQPLTLTGDLAMDNLRLYEAGGIEPELKTIDTSFDLQNGVSWTIAAGAEVPNPSNAQPGMCGQIIVTGALNGWGSAFKFPGGVGNVQPDIATYPAIVPYLVQTSGVVLLGTPISY